MASNTTNVINGTPQPGTLLALNGEPFTVRSVPLGQVEAGETIKALSEVEVTNDLVTKDAQGNNVFHDIGAGLTIVLATSPTATTGIEVAEAQSATVTPQVHHWTFEKSGTFTASQDLSGRYLNLVMWAYSAQPISDCWTFPRSSQPNPQQPRACGMDVDFNRGHLSALRTGPPGVAPAGATPFSVESFSGASLPEAAPADVPIGYAGDEVEFIVALSRPVGALQTNDVLTAHSELQMDARNVVRSNGSCNVGVATRLYLSPSPNSLDGARVIGAEGGYNFTGRGSREIRTLERGVVPSSTTFRLDQNYASPRYVVLRVWTRGNSACEAFGNGIRVLIDQPSSYLHVMRYRPVQQGNLVVETANSGDDSEQVGSLNVVSGDPATVYSQPLPDLRTGELIETLGELELNSTHRRAEAHTSPVLADAPTETAGLPFQVDNFTEISPYIGTLPLHDAAGWSVPADEAGDRYLNLVGRGVGLGTIGTAPDELIGVGADDGRLVVQRFRLPRTAPPEIASTSPASPANDNAPEVRGSAEAGTTVRLYESADCSGAVEAQGSATAFTSPGLTASVANNTSTSFSATATDPMGNVSPCSQPIAYVEDSAPPASPSGLAASPASPANDNSPQVSGSAEAGSTVRVYRAATTSGCTAANLLATGNAADFASPGLTASVADDSSNTLRATATDAAGNVSVCSSSSAAYVEDSTPPASPSSLATTPASPANDNSPEVRGSAEAGSTVRVYRAATTANCTEGNLAATGGAGAFSAPGLTAAVANDSSTTFRATATDAAGNVSGCSSSSAAYVEDSTPPASPSSLATTPASPANDNSPEVRGSAEAGSTVRVYRAATSSDCTPANLLATGAASAFSSPGLTAAVANDSSTTFRATATDAAGNVSGCSASSAAYVEDSTPPAPPSGLAASPGSPANDNSPQVSGSAEAGSTVRVYRAATTADCTDGNLAATGNAAAFGSPGLTATVANDTTTTFRARATDAAGNVSVCSSSSAAYVEDSTPPASPSSLATTPPSPSSDEDPEVSGSAEAGSTVRVYRAATSSDCTPANLLATGAASAFASPGLTVALTEDASHPLRAAATDAAGNVSDCSQPITYVEDSTPPAAPSDLATSPPSPANDNSPQVSGSAEAGSTVRVYRAATSSDCTPTNLLATGAAAAFASPGLTAPVANDTTTTFRATAADAAGNVSDCSTASIDYVEDSSLPEAPLIAATDPGSPANDNSPAVRGSAGAGLTVRLYESSDCSGPVEAQGPAGTFASPGLAASVDDDLTASFTATATDAAGNVSGCSSTYAYVEDSTAPETVILAGPRPRIRKRRASFQLGGEPGATLECRLNRRPFAPCSSFVAYKGLRLGRHRFRARARDEAGNLELSPALRRFRVLPRARRRR